MVEQYEHHCFIDSKSTSGSDTTLKATCYEFWDDYKKKVNGTKETIKLSLVSKDQLKINGKPYSAVPEKASSKDAKPAKIARGWPGPLAPCPCLRFRRCETSLGQCTSGPNQKSQNNPMHSRVWGLT